MLGRLGIVVLTIIALSAPALATEVVGGPGAGAAASAYDHSLDEADCTLLGRRFVKASGCSRTRCTTGAVPWRTTYGAEACTLRQAPQGFGYVATVDVRQCKALHRKWIAQVNYCASEPDRSSGALFNAPQCIDGATVYVNLEETDGYYDECLTLGRAVELVQQAAVDGSTLEEEVSLRSAAQCPHRPGHVLLDGECVVDPTSTPSGGGVLMIGDSLTWRGSDELGRMRPTFTLDGEPARPPTELASRLAYFRSGHGEPDGLIIELGTVPAKRFSRDDLAQVVRSLPEQTRVMFVLPYYELNSHPVVVTPQSRKVDGWMRSIARSRGMSCVADWPAYAHAHPGTLQDGVHTKHPAEGRWAHWISQQWARC
jgi:hypothetical protein